MSGFGSSGEAPREFRPEEAARQIGPRPGSSAKFSKASWYSSSAAEFLDQEPSAIVDRLSRCSAEKYAGDHRLAVASWESTVRNLRLALSSAGGAFANASEWGVCLEFSLQRLEKRIDAVLLVGSVIVVIEFKTGASDGGALRQVEEYALDLRDFHEGSKRRRILPVVCSGTAKQAACGQNNDLIEPVRVVDQDGLAALLCQLAVQTRDQAQVALQDWLDSPYRPVPSIVEAAQALFSGHDVAEVADAGATNLAEVSNRLAEIAKSVRERGKRAVCFVTGVPGAGKTLVGLNAVHDPRFGGSGGVTGAFLSGNTPLVAVLREALARDRAGRETVTLGESRRHAKTQIQGLMGFLRQYLEVHPQHEPAEHFVVFDEAQRAWDADYGAQKFKRASSEPELFLEIMRRRSDWSMIIALVGGGQEIGRGERGLKDWALALLQNAEAEPNDAWEVYGPPQIFGEAGADWRRLFARDDYIGHSHSDEHLSLDIGLRSHRCSALGDWVNLLLDGSLDEAKELAEKSDIPVWITRDQSELRSSLSQLARGFRRVGLVASSTAKRLRAEGLGVSLSATDLDPVTHWYLDGPDDIRSSYALEVTANEYTCQGLELDHVGLCWDADLVFTEDRWITRRLNGTKWQQVSGNARNYALNKYRVLLTRARAGSVIWVPQGCDADGTRKREWYDSIAAALRAAGVKPLRQPLV